MSDERVTELLGFAPIHFIDETLNIANQSIYKSIAKFESKVEEFGGQNDKGVAQVETLLEKSIDSKFDRFELYCLKNIFSFPKDLKVVLPHYQGYDMNVTVEEEEEMDLKIDQLRAQRVAERYKNLKLQQAQERLEKRKMQLDRLNATLQELSAVAQEAGVYPVDKNLVDMKEMLDQVNQVMAQVESRTTNTEWESVPLIGAPSSSSSRLKSVQQEVIYHLKKFNQKDGKTTLSAWDVANEYRDAAQVGSAKNIETIRSSLL